MASKPTTIEIGPDGQIPNTYHKNSAPIDRPVKRKRLLRNVARHSPRQGAYQSDETEELLTQDSPARTLVYAKLPRGKGRKGYYWRYEADGHFEYCTQNERRKLLPERFPPPKNTSTGRPVGRQPLTAGKYARAVSVRLTDAAHEFMQTEFGNVSKGLRTLVQMAIRSSMTQEEAEAQLEPNTPSILLGQALGNVVIPVELVEYLVATYGKNISAALTQAIRHDRLMQKVTYRPGNEDWEGGAEIDGPYDDDLEEETEENPGEE